MEGRGGNIWRCGDDNKRDEGERGWERMRVNEGRTCMYVRYTVFFVY